MLTILTDKFLVKELSVDELLDEIGIGKYHYRMISLHLLNILVASMQIVIPGIILPTISHDFSLSQLEKSVYGGLEFLGLLLSSVFIARCTNGFGQKNSIFLAFGCWNLGMLVCIFSTNIYVFSIARCLVAFSYLTVSMVSYAALSEITPQRFRGIALNCFAVCGVIGFSLTAFLAYYLFDDINTGDWRLLFVYLTFVLIFLVVLNQKYLHNSCRFEFFLGDYAKAYEMINQMAYENLKVENFMTEQKKEQVEMWYSNFKNNFAKIKRGRNSRWFESILCLFRGAYKRITWIMLWVFSISQVTNWGTDFILGSTLNEIAQKNNINPLFLLLLSNTVVLPFTFLIIFLAESPKTGRKFSLMIFLLLTGISNFGTFFEIFPGSIFWLSVSKIALRGSMTLVFLFSIEIYPTTMRMQAMGFLSTTSRMATILTSWLEIYLMEINLLLPYLLFGLLGFLGFYALSKLPYDTYQQNIDRVIEEE